jgi:hypothetical protein
VGQVGLQVPAEPGIAGQVVPQVPADPGVAGQLGVEVPADPAVLGVVGQVGLQVSAEPTSPGVGVQAPAEPMGVAGQLEVQVPSEPAAPGSVGQPGAQVRADPGVPGQGQAKPAALGVAGEVGVQIPADPGVADQGDAKPAVLGVAGEVGVQVPAEPADSPLASQFGPPGSGAGPVRTPDLPSSAEPTGPPVAPTVGRRKRAGPAARLTRGAPPAGLAANASPSRTMPAAPTTAVPSAPTTPVPTTPPSAVPTTPLPGPIGVPQVEVPDDWAGEPVRPDDPSTADTSTPSAGSTDTDVFHPVAPGTEVPDTEIPGNGTGGDEPSADSAPEVELSETEVEQVLSGRVIPIGTFFSGAASHGSQADDATPVAGATFLADAGRIALTWAEDRYLGLTSACGICIALSVCAAAWFSAGTRVDIVRGVAALWAGYLILRAGQWVVRQPRPEQARRDAAGTDAASADSGITGAHGGGLAVRRAGKAADRRRAGPVAWLSAIGSAAAECAVYAGLALGAVAEHWTAVWPLAIAVLSLVAVRNLMTVCSTPPGFTEPSRSAFRRVSEAVLTMPFGGRILLVGIVASVWGARVALLAVLDWAIVSIGYGLAGRVAVGMIARNARRGPPKRVAAESKLVRLRDDGTLARALGTLVQGNLMPLPPAILGLAAISALAVLGLHGLPGALLIGPAVVMLLAAPGSANPHTGRFDWLVPVLLLGAQCLYFAAIGQAERVPGPIVYALIAALLLRYADLGGPDRPLHLAKPRDPDREPFERGTALGWEGRLLFAGLTAAMGVAEYAYLALTVYLLVLLGAKVAASCLAPEEEVKV